MTTKLKLTRNARIKLDILERIAGHMGCEPRELASSPLLGDGVGKHYLLLPDDCLLILDTVDPDDHVDRLQGASRQRWFRGEMLSDTDPSI
jgi:hypothetical protein